MSIESDMDREWTDQAVREWIASAKLRPPRCIAQTAELVPR